MRVSIQKGDRAYDPSHARRVRSVTLDGATVTAVTADEEEGFVLVFQADGHGGVKRDPVSGDFLLKRLTGNVQINLAAPDARAWDKNRRQSGVRVQVGREPGTNDLLVQVFSVVRPGALKQGRLPLDRQPAGEAALCQAAGVIAGGVAELLCDQFGDTLDPEAAAAEAVRQCARMIADGRG